MEKFSPHNKKAISKQAKFVVSMGFASPYAYSESKVHTILIKIRHDASILLFL